VKYATFDEADRAIKALNNQYTFVGVRTTYGCWVKPPFCYSFHQSKLVFII